MRNKIIDCVTFFDNNFMFEFRYNVLKNYVDYFVICESIFDHRGNSKQTNFIAKPYYNLDKVKYVVLEKPFPKNTSIWENQAIQREFLLKSTDFADKDDYIFFSDPDEIPNPQLLQNFMLKKKYGIFMQKCFNFKFNLFNKYESPWEGTRVCKKKNLKSIDFMRQKVVRKNLHQPFWKFYKEKSIQLFENGGWHFNSLLKPEDISIKLKSFAHREFKSDEYSSIDVIKKNINERRDLFKRDRLYKKVDLDKSFPDFIVKNKDNLNEWIL